MGQSGEEDLRNVLPCVRACVSNAVVLRIEGKHRSKRIPVGCQTASLLAEVSLHEHRIRCRTSAGLPFSNPRVFHAIRV